MTLREKLIKIAAKVVRHSRNIVLQMAEVAVPKSCSDLFYMLSSGCDWQPRGQDPDRTCQDAEK